MPTAIRDVLAGAATALAAGDSTSAAKLARHVLASYSKHIGAHWLLAQVAVATGFGQVAEDLLSRVLSADPTHARARLALARHYSVAGDLEGALREALIAREQTPDDPEAVALVEQLAGPRLAAVWPSRGWLARQHLARALDHRAATEAEAILATDPTRLDVRLVAALALSRMGERDLARDACAALLDDSPDCLLGLLLSVACARRGDEASIAELWTRARQLDPEDTLARTLVAFSEVPLPPGPAPDLPSPPMPLPRRAPQRADDQGDVARLEALVAGGEGPPTARLELAALHARRGEVGAALSQYRVLLRTASVELPAVADGLAALAEEHGAPAAWRLLGDVYLKMGDLARAGAAYARGATL